MIYGIGTDIVHIPRIANVYTRFGDSFVERILTLDELCEFGRVPKPIDFLATRFAVKEAVAKALGTGFTEGLAYKHIGITYDERRKPSIVFLGRAAEMLQEKHISHSHITISHEVEYAIIYVILETS
jgi:holo-[acyl-carrier protein] synthase